jgi:proteasome activator subunit 4
MSPPPAWMPGVLLTLSRKATGDPGVIGQSVKSIIGNFKKTRQDTRHIDVYFFIARNPQFLFAFILTDFPLFI